MNDISSLLETIPCPVCGSGNYRILRRSHYPAGLSERELLETYSSSSDKMLMDQLVRCDSCGLVYLNPRVREQTALDSYVSAQDETFVMQDSMRMRTFKKYFSLMAGRLGIRPSKEVRVLDVGCAGGSFVKVASDLGFEAVGIEPSKWLCDYGAAHYKIDIRQGTLIEQSFEDCSFGIVTLWDVLEHMHHPMENLRECRRIIKRGGYLIVNVPDHSSLTRRLLGFRWPFYLNVHLYYFTPQTIKRALQECGFETMDSGAFFQTLELSYVLKRASAYFGFFSAFQAAADWLGIGRLPLTYNMGQTYFIARRTDD